MFKERRHDTEYVSAKCSPRMSTVFVPIGPTADELETSATVSTHLQCRNTFTFEMNLVHELKSR